MIATFSTDITSRLLPLVKGLGDSGVKIFYIMFAASLVVGLFVWGLNRWKQINEEEQEDETESDAEDVLEWRHEEGGHGLETVSPDVDMNTECVACGGELEDDAEDNLCSNCVDDWYIDVDQDVDSVDQEDDEEDEE